MARLVGTGKDPNGQYGEGVLFDVPRDEPHYAELVENGWATPVAPADDPARGTVDVAQAVVRGDALLHPSERAIADHIGDRAHAIVQTQDPDAAPLASDAEPVAARPHYNPDERPYEGTPDGSSAATSDWEDGPQVGDLATHTTLSAEEGEAPGSPRYPSDAREEAARQAQAEGTQPQADGTTTGTADEGNGGQALGDDATPEQWADLQAKYGVDGDSRVDALADAYSQAVAAGDVVPYEEGKGSGSDGALIKADYERAFGLGGAA